MLPDLSAMKWLELLGGAIAHAKSRLKYAKINKGKH